MAAVFRFVGIEIDMDDFTRRDGSQLLIDSTNLIRYISEFERQFRDLRLQAQIASVQIIDRVLTVTQRLVVRECSMTSPFNGRSENWPFDPITSLSFMILGCTLAFVLSLPHADRTKTFLEQMDGIPSDIVFMPGPRLSEDGWKWAPTSFMARHQWTAYEHFKETIIPGAPDHIITEQTNISHRFTEAYVFTSLESHSRKCLKI